MLEQSLKLLLLSFACVGICKNALRSSRYAAVSRTRLTFYQSVTNIAAHGYGVLGTSVLKMDKDRFKT